MLWGARTGDQSKRLHRTACSKADRTHDEHRGNEHRHSFGGGSGGGSEGFSRYGRAGVGRTGGVLVGSRDNGLLDQLMQEGPAVQLPHALGLTGAHNRGDSGHLMRVERVAPQSEVVSVIALEGSQGCEGGPALPPRSHPPARIPPERSRHTHKCQPSRRRVKKGCEDTSERQCLCEERQ